MITLVFALVEAMFSLLLLLITVSDAYGYDRTFLPRTISIFLWECCFVFLYSFLLHILPLGTETYISYFAALFFCCISYILIFIKNHTKNAITLTLVYICAVNSFKVCIGCILNVIPFYQNTTELVSNILFELFYLSTLFICIHFFRKYPIRLSGTLPIKYWIIIMAIPVLLLFSLQLFILNTYSQPIPFISFLFFAVVTVTVLSLYYLSYTIVQAYESLSETHLINQRLKLQIDNMERSSGMVEQIRRDKHEMKNVYFYIASLVNSRQYEELTEFVNKKLLHRFDAMEEIRTGNTFVDFLLTQKVSEAREYSIHVVTNVLIPANLSIDQNDLCGLLLNLLDNAIDASKNETPGDIHISIRQIKNYLSIQIKNRSSVDVLKNNPQLLTSKKDRQNHGIGLRVVTSIVHKYSGMMNTYMKSGYFTVDVMLMLQV